MSDLYDVLMKPGEEGDKAWSTFLFNVDAALSLVGELTTAQITQLLAREEAWQGCGWTTSKASLCLWEWTGIPLVSPEVNVYRDSWLFAVALAANVEIATGSLSDRASEAAFATATNITSTEAHTRPAEEEVVDEDSELERLPWDAPEVPLPKTLSCILKGVLEGKRRLEV